MASVTAALRLVKDDLRHHLDEPLIHKLCEEVGHVWRERTLGPVVTLWLFVQQVMAGNVACAAVRHLGGIDVSAAAYCEARKRLPLELFKRLMHSVCESLRPGGAEVGLWHGHRTFHLDGSGFSMPDTPALQKHFGQPGNQKPGCGFPVSHLLALFDAATGLLIDVIASPLRTHDMAHAAAMLKHLRPGDVLIADRGFCSYAHLALVLRHNLHAVFRLHQRMIVDFTAHRPHNDKGRKHRKGRPRSRWVRSLGAEDQVVEWIKPSQRPAWISPADYDALPDSITVRELIYTVDRPGFRTTAVTLVTTLLDPVEYPAAELAELYRQRWHIELNFRHLKITMGMDVLRCKSVDGVLKELYVFALAYNLVRRVVLLAAERQGVAPDRVSFIDALRWLRYAEPDDELTPLVVNPDRRGHVEPRVRKRRPKEYPVMKQPRHELRQALMEAADAH